MDKVRKPNTSQICCLITYTDGRYDANDAGYMTSNSGTVSNEKYTVRLVNKA
jgi:hypothetical protein